MNAKMSELFYAEKVAFLTNHIGHMCRSNKQLQRTCMTFESNWCRLRNYTITYRKQAIPDPSSMKRMCR